MRGVLRGSIRGDTGNENEADGGRTRPGESERRREATRGSGLRLLAVMAESIGAEVRMGLEGLEDARTGKEGGDTAARHSERRRQCARAH